MAWYITWPKWGNGLNLWRWIWTILPFHVKVNLLFKFHITSDIKSENISDHRACKAHYNEVIWALRHLGTLATWLFVQQLVQLFSVRIPSQRASSLESASKSWCHHVVSRHVLNVWISLNKSVRLLAPVHDKSRCVLISCSVIPNPWMLTESVSLSFTTYVWGHRAGLSHGSWYMRPLLPVGP